MVILESAERKASWQRLAGMIRKVRRAAQELGPLTPEQIAAEVAAVRAQREEIGLIRVKITGESNRNQLSNRRTGHRGGVRQSDEPGTFRAQNRRTAEEISRRR